MFDFLVFIIAVSVCSALVGIIVVAIVLSKKSSNKQTKTEIRKSIEEKDYIKNDASSRESSNYISLEEYKGYEAERYISLNLKRIANEIGNSYLINNVIIPSGKDSEGNERTVEIDHILFTPSGLFVVETKSRAGTIYGEEEDDDWYQVLGYEDIREHRFYNPIKQNDIHIRALRRLLNKKDLVCYSCIVFEDGDISNIDSDLVIEPSELDGFIIDSAVEDIYNQQDLLVMFNRIQYYKDNPPKTKEAHIQEVHKNHGYDA